MGSGADGKGNTRLVLAASNDCRYESFSESSLSDASLVLPGT